MPSMFEATLPAEIGILRLYGPSHSGDLNCRVAAQCTYSADFSSGAQLNADQLDALICALQSLRCVMVRK